MQTAIVNYTEQDAQAVHAVRAGDAERYRELVERHERRVYAVAWSRLGDAASAEDVTQEAFIRAYRGLWLLGDGSKFAGWINAIARNVAVNFGIRHRRELKKRERWALEQAAQGEPAPLEAGADVPCTPETLRQTLAKLPDAHRECLVLFHLEGKSGAEAAAALGISEAALRVRLHRARAALRERLEERLADSLGRLGPAKTLVPSVMAGVLVTSSAKAATASGGAAAILGTFAKLVPLQLLLLFSAAVVGALPSMALTALAGRAEQRNFRDPAGFRAQMARAINRTILWVVPLTVIPLVIGILMLTRKIGQVRSDWVLAVFTVACFAWAWRLFGGRGRLQRGMLIWYGMLAGGMVLKAAGLVSANGYTWVFIAATLWLMWIQRWQPARMDNSLFFRAMMGMLENPPPGTPAAPPALRLEKSDLDRFGKFLADRNLVNGFRWRPEGLLLRQGFVKPSWPMNKAAVFKAAFPLATRDSSNILLHWNGEVTAQISERDDRTQRVLKPEEAAQRAKIQTQVAAAVAQAWQAFRQGDHAAADRALGEKSDLEIFHVPPARAAAMRWRQVSLGLVVLLFLGMMLVGKYPQLLRPFFGRHPQRMMMVVMDQMYGPLIKQLGLTADEATRFKTLLADHAMKAAPKAPSRFDAVGSTNSAGSFQVMSADQKAFDAQVKAFLGDDRYAQYMNYLETLSERMLFNQFKQEAGSDYNLNDRQTEALLTIIGEEKKNVLASKAPRQTGGNQRAMMSPDQLFQNQEAVNQRVYQRARTILSPEQLDTLARFQTNQLQILYKAMGTVRKMSTPSAAASAPGVTNALLLQAASATQTPAATNQLPHPGNP